MDVTIEGPLRQIPESFEVPTDKSISHRAILVGALARGRSVVHRSLASRDCHATIDCLRGLGVVIEQHNSDVIIEGVGLSGLQEPSRILDAQNSGTTMRLLSGILAGRPFYSVLTGDDSLRRRPMARVVEPLRAMGAHIDGRHDGRLAPLAIRGGNLVGIRYSMPVASAQVKSALILAGLQAEGTTAVHEPLLSRDHTERMLSERGVEVRRRDDGWIEVNPGEPEPADITVPGDPSAAAFLIALGVLIPGALVRLQGVLSNPTRIGFIERVQAMGANITLADGRIEHGEPITDLVIRHSELQGTTVTAEQVPGMIDEFPILAVLATQAQGVTVVRGAEELRVKESDRIAGICEGLRQMGGQVEDYPDGFMVEGPTPLKGADLDPEGDHRLAMAFGVAAAIASGTTVIRGANCVDVSFPHFWEQILQA